MEPHPSQFVEHLVQVFNLLGKVLKPTGSAYVALGDTYCSSGKWGGQAGQTIGNGAERNFPQGRRPSGAIRPDGHWIQRKQLLFLPSRIAIAMQERGWILRNDIIWHKTNGLPSSVKDRLSNRYEHIFHFVKDERYYYNLDAIREPYKASSFQRFRGLVRQDFIKRESKYAQIKLPPGVQFSSGKTPVPSWLELIKQTSGKANTIKKMQHLYQQSKGMVGHGHYAGGEYRGISSHWLGKNPGDVWSLPTSMFRGAHFSVYPEGLCVKPILSSCPSLVCKACGFPKREVAGQPEKVGAAFNIRVRDAKKGILSEKWGARVSAAREEVAKYEEFFYRTRGRERVLSEGCSCNAGYQPGVVLDPFAGSGTTMKVALALGRSAIGIELNPDYVALIRQRVPGLSSEDVTYLRDKPASSAFSLAKPHEASGPMFLPGEQWGQQKGVRFHRTKRSIRN